MYRDKLPDEPVDEVWQRFRDALMPLHSAGKLGAVLFQFPQWFVIAKKNKAYIEECAARLPDYRVAVEFRHESWMSERNREETLSFLEEHDLPFVCVDMPQGFVSSVPPIAATTPTIWRWCGSTGATRSVDGEERERRRTASVTTTRRPSCRSGCRRSDQLASRPGRHTCS